ncbi:MAG: GNAT family N-acetyltransferase [Acetobacteraceae bacterium]
MEIRPEGPEEGDAIRSVITAAFKTAKHSNNREAAIVDALRAGGAMTVSLVALDQGATVGQVAFSPVTIDRRDPGSSGGWFGLGPVSVRADCQSICFTGRVPSGMVRYHPRFNAR